MRLFFIKILLILLINNLWAQRDTIYQLPEINIAAPRVNTFATGAFCQHFDSLTLLHYENKSFADLLSKNTSVTVKNYGLSSLSTLSARGTGAGHSTVLWNGLNLQNAMSGVLDFSLIPIQNIDCTLYEGSNTTLAGNGAIGATLSIMEPNHQVSLNDYFQSKISLGAASFDNYRQGLTLSFGKKKVWIDASIQHQTAKNNFVYNDITQFGSPSKKLHNAAAKMLAFFQNGQYQINDNQRFDWHLWYQQNERQIPPSMTEADSKSVQLDSAFRATVHYAYYLKKIAFNLRTGYIQEGLLYSIIAGNGAHSKSQSIQNEADATFEINSKHLLNFGLNEQYTRASTEGYKNIARHQLAFLMAWKWEPSNWCVISTALRPELTNKKWNPFTGSVGTELKLKHRLKLLSKISKNYKLPTFNDLYWADGYGKGNPNLLPESGYSGEIGLKNDFTNWHFQLTHFQILVDNWIQWTTKDGLLQPINYKKVWSRGLNLNFAYNFQISAFKYACIANYQWVRSSPITVNSNNAIASLYKQLEYVPMHNANFSMNVYYKNIQLTFNQILQGKRFDTSDNSAFLKPYTLSDLSVGYNVKCPKNQITVYFDMNNIFNVSYQVIRFRPMPGINFSIGARWEFLK